MIEAEVAGAQVERTPAPAIELTILMPCLNEAATLPACIRKAKEFLQRTGIAGEILIADNGSKDGSQEVARQMGARVIHVARRGYGSALTAGIEAARGRYVIMGDSDASYDFSKLDLYVNGLRAGADLVMGNRFAGIIEPGAMPALHRYLGNPVLSGIGRVLFQSGCRDFHCGLRGFQRDAILKLGLSTPGMEFASEMVVRASMHGLRIVEVPTTLSPDGRDRPPHLRSWRDGWRHLRLLLLFSPRSLFLYPGAAMFGVGLAAMLVLLSGPILIGQVGLDIGTLLYSAASVLIGWQSVLFWVCAKVHNAQQTVMRPNPGFERVMRRLSLEAVLLSSLAVFLVGLLLATESLAVWGTAGFGALDPASSLRRAVAAVTIMLLAAQTASAGLFVAMLRIGRGAAW
jgi:glycosyltransferase involved in cell wall biosynthesis